VVKNKKTNKMDKNIKESKFLKKYQEFNMGIVYALIIVICGVLKLGTSIPLVLLSLVALVDLMVSVITKKMKDIIIDVFAIILLWLGAIFLR
jgi:uncharacterized protein YqhQ